MLQLLGLESSTMMRSERLKRLRQKSLSSDRTFLLEQQRDLVARGLIAEYKTALSVLDSTEMFRVRVVGQVVSKCSCEKKTYNCSKCSHVQSETLTGSDRLVEICSPILLISQLFQNAKPSSIEAVDVRAAVELLNIGESHWDNATEVYVPLKGGKFAVKLEPYKAAFAALQRHTGVTAVVSKLKEIRSRIVVPQTS